MIALYSETLLGGPLYLHPCASRHLNDQLAMTCAQFIGGPLTDAATT